MQLEIIDFFKTILLLFFNTIIEFLPISSTAHGILFNKFIKINNDIKLILAISQMSILISLLYYFREKILSILKNFFKDKSIRKFCYRIIIATIPAIIFGFLFNNIIKKYFFSNITIAIFLIVGGIALIYIENFFRVKSDNIIEFDLYSIPEKIMYKVGLFQAIALLPGISRSASTICSAIYYGLSKKTSIEFSFFLSIPISFAGSVFDILKNFNFIDNYFILSVYFVINVVFAIFFAKNLINFLKDKDLSIFGYYRIIFGLILLFF